MEGLGAQLRGTQHNLQLSPCLCLAQLPYRKVFWPCPLDLCAVETKQFEKLSIMHSNNILNELLVKMYFKRKKALYFKLYKYYFSHLCWAS